MERYQFFNSENGDRKYNANDWSEYFEDFFTAGIFNNSLKVKPGSGMQVIIEPGKAFAKGHKYINDSDLSKTISIADGNQDRIDNIVLRVDETNRTFLAQVIQGNYASDPVAPNLVRDIVTHDLRIATVHVPAGATEITVDMITDCRFNSSDCGNVIQAVQSPELTKIFDQCMEQVQSAVNNIKDILSGDVAGHLQNEINDIRISLGLYTDTYDSSHTYSENDLTVHEHKIYSCNTNNTTGTWDSTKWDLVPIINNN